MDFPSRRSSRRSTRPRRGDPAGDEPRRPSEQGAETGPAGDDWLAGAEAEAAVGDESAKGRTRRGRPSETVLRVLIAVPWIVFAVAIIIIGELPFALAMVAFAWLGLIELFRMTARARPFIVVGFVASAGMVLAAHFGSSFQMVLVGVAAFPLMFGFAASRELRSNITYSMAITVFGIVWIGLPFAHAVLLRGLPEHGAALLVDVLVATFVADTAAYLGGRMFGKRPLAPAISPNKTVEGLACGIVAGTLGFWVAGLYQDWLPGSEALAMGLVVALLAPVGDLFASMVKRDLDVKDTGKTFGPHGGVLDRLDAVMFTIVAGYYLSLAFVY